MILNPKQKWSIKEATARLNFWHGSVRSGKSIGTDLKSIQAFAEPMKGLPPDAIDVIIGKTLYALRRNVINPIIEFVGQRNAEYFPGKQELRLFGRTVHTIGANDERSVGKIQGSTIRKCLGDEVVLWPESFFKMLDSRLSLEQSQFFGTMNPGPPKHYIKRDYIDRCGEEGFNAKHFKFLLDDNIALLKASPAYIQAIKKNYTGLWYRRFILGEWCMAEGAIYDFFDENAHVITKTPEAEYYILGGDYGTSNPTCFILFGVNRKSRPKIWAEHEYYFDSAKAQRQKTNGEYSEDFIEFCKEKLGKYWQTLLRRSYFDPSAESLQLQLRKDGVASVVDANNEVLTGIACVATMLKTGEYAIHERCENLISEKSAYVWDSKKQEKGIDEPLKTNDHASDAERYGVFSEFGDEISDLSLLSVM